MANAVEASTTIRIYPSFTEVRENVATTSPHQIYFPQDLYNQIMQGSINLEGANITSINAVLKENNLEGKVIHINKDKQVRQVKMIRSRDSLVQDLETSRYYHVDRNQIEFGEVPEETGTELTFTLENPGAAVLSYLMYGITWKPRYTFNITGENNTFQGWADITNNTNKDYYIEKTEMFGGDVAVKQRQHDDYGGGVYMAMCASSGMRSAAPTVRAVGEVSGLYMYSIGDSYKFYARSTYSLPFVSPIIQLKKVAYLNTYFSQSNDKGQASRVYRIKSSDFLPNGTVTVREDGRVVGQSNVPDLSADEENDLTVGNDADVLYDRKVKSLACEETFSEHEVTVTVRNKKSRSVNFEYIERFHGRFEASSEDDKVKIQNDFAKREGSLDAKSEVSFVFKVKCFIHGY